MIDPDKPREPYTAYGKAVEIFYERAREFCFAGPAGTGKSRGMLERMDLFARKYPKSRHLFVRKTRTSLTQTGLVTFEQEVLPERTTIKLHKSDQEYRYPNDSRIVIGGLDNPTKIMSGQYDTIYVMEATERGFTEDDWEKLLTRLRNNRMPFRQLSADCNPEAPQHFLKKRETRGVLKMINSRHEDNPTLFDQTTGEMTPLGVDYIGGLDSLTGVRYLRLRKGIWAAAEGMIYEIFDPDHNIIDNFGLKDTGVYDSQGNRILEPILTPPLSWPRYLAIDFGYNNPFVCQWWAEDPDGRLYLYREIFRTKRLVEDHARDILEIMKKHGEPRPRAVVVDHDAEDRATLEKYLLLQTTPANKAVKMGIEHVIARIRKSGDGRARIFFLRDALVARDKDLELKKKPLSTLEEIGSYIWDDDKQEEPVKENDHGCDAARYMVCFRDYNPAEATFTVTKFRR